MKKIKLLMVFLLMFSLQFAFGQENFRLSMTLNPGEYLFNSTDLYFFDDGIDCYLFNQCNDVDTVFEGNSIKYKLDKDSTINYRAFLFTDTYEYVYTIINGEEGWLRIKIPIDENERKFFNDLLVASRFEEYSSFVEVIPFKKTRYVFISTTDDWFIADLRKLETTYIGTKGGSLQACQMIFSENCVKCYIDLGWGKEIWYNYKGKKKKVEDREK